VKTFLRIASGRRRPTCWVGCRLSTEAPAHRGLGGGESAHTDHRRA